MTSQRFFVALISLFVFLGLGVAFAAEQATIEPTPYPNAFGPGGIVQPQHVSCGAWGPWLNVATYCESKKSLLCICTTESGWVQYTDRYRVRTCYNAVTNDTYEDYSFNTKRDGCCGSAIPGCPSW